MSGTSPHDKKRVLLETGALAGLFLVGIARERHAQGVELLLLALPLLLLGPAFRRWLAWRGRAAPAPPALFGLELASFAGLATYPFAWWGLALAGLANLALARWRTTSATSPRATPGEEAFVLLLAAGAATKAWVDLEAWTGLHGGAVAAVLLGLALEAFGPRRPRTAEAAGRRAAGFALAAAAVALGNQEALFPGIHARPVLLAIASLAGLGAGAGFARDHLSATPADARATPRLRRLAAFGLAAALALNVWVLTGVRLLASERRVDLRTLEVRHEKGEAATASFPHYSFAALPEDARLLEDGKPLAHPFSWSQDIATLGSGRYSVAVEVVRFSSSDHTDPLANGRSYTLEFKPEVHRSVLARGLFGLACVFLLAAWSQGALRLSGRSPLAHRAVLAAVTFAALAAGLPRGWDQISVQPDSLEYLARPSPRPPLYSAFIDAFDRAPRESRPGLACDPADTPFHVDPEGRFLGVVHAQKVLCLLSVVLLVWVFSGTLNAWLVGLMTYAAGQADLGAPNAGAVTHNMRTLLSEGLNHPLVFLYVAAAFAYLRRPSWLPGLAVSTVTALLLLNRPANGVFVLVFGLIWIFHASREGARTATARAALLGLACAAPVLLACLHVQRETGHFRLQSMTGKHVFGQVFPLATPDDVGALADPVEREFLRTCFADHPNGSVSHDDPAYAIGLPSLAKVKGLPPENTPARDVVADDFLRDVGQRLLARHKLEFARLALFHFGQLFRPEHDVTTLAAVVIAALLYRRTRSWLLLFFAFFACLSFVSMAPSCVFSAPIPRYFSQLAFADFLTLPLLATVLATPGGGLVPEPRDGFGGTSWRRNDLDIEFRLRSEREAREQGTTDRRGAEHR